MTVVSGSLSGTASLASTASSADNFLVRNTLTAQTLVVQTITSSIDFVTGSTRFGSLSANTHTFTGSILASGSVGIGIANPTSRLHLSSSGTTLITVDSPGTGSYSAISFNNTTSTFGYDVGFGGSTSLAPNSFYIYGGTVKQMRLVVDPTGNVGIGTTTPSASLEVNGKAYIGGNTSNSNYQLFVKRGTDRAMGIGLQGGDLSIEFVNDAVSANVPTRIYANPLVVLGGNVGIGLSSPIGLLHLSGAIANNADAATLTIKQPSTTYTNGIYLERGGERNGYHIYIGGALDSLTFRRNYVGTQSEVMSLTRNGNVGIGTTSPDRRFRVASDGDNWITGVFGGAGGTDVTVVGNLSGGAAIGGHNSTLTAWAQFSLNPGGGAVYAGTLRIDNNSDQRFKRNITSVENALDTILQLQGRKFNMIDEDNILRYGFVAQEVQPVLSDFVTESNREHKDENVHITNLLTLETSGAAWAALLVEAIKELKADNDAIRAELAALKS
jgi:hypothetical protein